MLGKTGEEVIGRAFLDVFPMVRDTLPHGTTTGATVRRQARGSSFEMISPILKHWVHFSVSPTAEGGVSVHFRDISVQKGGRGGPARA